MTLQEFADFVRLCAVDSPIPVEIHGAVMAEDDRVRVRVRVGFEPRMRVDGGPHGDWVPATATVSDHPDERLNVSVDIGADDLEALPTDTGAEFVGDTVQELVARAVAEWVARRVTIGGQRLGTKNETLQSPLAPIIARAQPEGVLAAVGEIVIWRARKLRVAYVNQDTTEILLERVFT